MKSVRITTLPDQGAAEVARDALGEAGIPAELEQRENDNPYLKTTLVPWSVWVPADRVKDAEGILEALQLELEGQAEIASAAAEAREDAVDDEGDAPLAETKPARTLSGVLLSFLVPLPVSSFYAGNPKNGIVFLGLFAGTFALVAGYDKGQAPTNLLGVLAVLKAVDGIYAAIAVAIARRYAASERKT